MASEEEEEAEEMENLEREVAEMAKRVANYRSTMPRQLIALASTLASKRPPDIADVAQSINPVIIAEGVPLVEEDRETSERAQVLKEKISDNISAVPVLLKRMKDVISRFDKLDSCNLPIPPIYKKKRTR